MYRTPPPPLLLGSVFLSLIARNHRLVYATVNRNEIWHVTLPNMDKKHVPKLRPLSKPSHLL